jgi:hypothetical protein
MLRGDAGSRNRLVHLLFLLAENGRLHVQCTDPYFLIVDFSSKFMLSLIVGLPPYFFA